MRFVQILIVSLACQHPLRGAPGGGAKNEVELAATSQEFQFLNPKSRCKKCGLTEMTLLMTSLPLGRV